MKILIESANNHSVENYGKNELTFECQNQIVFIRARIQGIEHEFDFDLDVEEFDKLVQTIRIQQNNLKFLK
jgi:hypothetical protein